MTERIGYDSIKRVAAAHTGSPARSAQTSVDMQSKQATPTKTMPKMPQPAVSVGTLVSPSRIIIIKGTPEKDEAMQSLVRVLCAANPELKPAEITERVRAREQGISTTLDTGLSIPHCRLEGINNFLVAMAIIPEGMEDKASPGLKIRVMFLFLSPSNPQFFQKHLQLLSSLSALFQPAFIDTLAACATPEQAAAEITARK